MGRTTKSANESAPAVYWSATATPRPLAASEQAVVARLVSMARRRGSGAVYVRTTPTLSSISIAVP